MFLLCFQVGLTKGVDHWLLNLKDQVAKSLHELALNVATDCGNGLLPEEWVIKVREIISQ